MKAIIRTAKDYNFDMKLLQAVEDVNQAQKSVLIPKIKDHFGGDINGKKFAIWGLSFKPKTDDMREAPSIEIMKALHSAGATIAAHDPVAMEEAKHMGVTEYATLCDDNFDTLHDADGLVLVTEWLNYREPDFKQMKSMMRTPVIFDGRNVYNPQKMREIGFAYYGIGRR